MLISWRVVHAVDSELGPALSMLPVCYIFIWQLPLGVGFWSYTLQLIFLLNFRISLCSKLGCDIGGAKEPGVIYLATNWGAKEPQNLPNHRVEKKQSSCNAPLYPWIHGKPPAFDGNHQHFPLEGGEVNKSPHTESGKERTTTRLFTLRHTSLPFRYLYSNYSTVY